MLEYIIGSGISCIILTQVTGIITQYRMEDLGYVGISENSGEKKTSLKSHVLGFLSNFIPVINNLVGLVLLVVSGYMTFASDDSISALFDKIPSFKKASEAKKIYDRRIQSNNFDAMEDAMKLDGADKSVIEEEMANARYASGIPNDKTMKKINAMSDAELWLMEIELDTNLSEQEKRELYLDYVRDFSKDKTKPKAIEKTLKIVEKK